MQLGLIGENLKRARQRLRLSQTTVGQEIGLPRQAISALEAGRREITVHQLVKLANLYRLQVESFFRQQQALSDQTPLPHVERRRNQSKTESTLDAFDRNEIQGFIQDLRAAGGSGVGRAPRNSAKPRTLQPLAATAAEVRRAADLSSPPVNVYKALSCLGMRVRMTTLHSISGAFIPGGDDWPPGVLINSDQPSDRQRYSAAHELGHYVLIHSEKGGEEIISPLGRRFSPKEVEADAFAAEFLMPATMILTELRQLKAKEGLEEQVYRLADRFLISYQAMIYRLTHLGLITATQKEALLKIRPSEIESKLLLKRKAQKAFDPDILQEICRRSSILPDLLKSIDGVRQLQELAVEEYARLVPEEQRADTAGTVYEKVALWVARTCPMPVPA